LGPGDAPESPADHRPLDREEGRGDTTQRPDQPEARGPGHAGEERRRAIEPRAVVGMRVPARRRDRRAACGRRRAGAADAARAAHTREPTTTPPRSPARAPVTAGGGRRHPTPPPRRPARTRSTPAWSGSVRAAGGVGGPGPATARLVRAAHRPGAPGEPQRRAAIRPSPGAGEAAGPLLLRDLAAEDVGRDLLGGLVAVDRVGVLLERGQWDVHRRLRLPVR